MEQHTNDFLWLRELLAINGMPRAKILPYYFQQVQGVPQDPAPQISNLISLPNGSLLMVRIRLGLNCDGPPNPFGTNIRPTYAITPPTTNLQPLSSAAGSTFFVADSAGLTAAPVFTDAFILAEIVQLFSGVCHGGVTANNVWILEGYQISPV